MVFDRLSGEMTVGSLIRANVFLCIYGDSDWLTFQQFRFRARLGIKSTYDIKGHLLQLHVGALLP